MSKYLAMRSMSLSESLGEDDPIVQLAKEGHPRIILTPYRGREAERRRLKLWKIVTKQINDFIESY